MKRFYSAVVMALFFAILPVSVEAQQTAVAVEPSMKSESVPDIAIYRTFKQANGITPELSSCHTAVVDGYVVEGHVPAASIKKMLQQRPDIRGLAAPGMPMGSPGMETAGVQAEAFDVLAIAHDGTTTVFDQIRPK